MRCFRGDTHPTLRALVWLKRDLRQRDHAALAAAGAAQQAMALFVFEPEGLTSAECHPRHLAFTLSCLAELRTGLAARGLPLQVMVGTLPQVFDTLQRQHRFTHLFSHEETGPGWTFERDKRVAAWCLERGVVWQQFAQTGVVRRLRTRNGWAARWQRRMAAPEAPVPAGFAGIQSDLADLPSVAQLGHPAPGDSQAGGERAAWDTLHSFLQQRGADYRRAISSPLTAQSGCSRLSPHLAFGSLSMRCVHQATEARIDELKAQADAPARRHAHALRGFAGRLRWHCHFMQKLEDEPAIEFRNFSRACDGLRESEFERARFDAWCAGRTGYPMVDACMRSLCAGGWLNFRMRAMLVSFAAYHLWLHWREPGLFLARQFLDFEPGIHWSQMQMQSGTTGINTVRIYSPTKQALDHDPHGVFIRRWVPELAGVPLPLLAEPWRLPPALQRDAGCVIGRDYPAPIVDDKLAVAIAKQRVYGLRGTAEAAADADRIQARHGSRKSGLAQTGGRGRARARASPQRDLFAPEDAG